jgi:hypothetical protein
MEPITGGAFVGILIGLIILGFTKLSKFTKNIEIRRTENFKKMYKLSVIGISTLFAFGIIILKYFSAFLAVKPEINTAIEIVLYGMLWVMATVIFILGFHRTKARLIIPGLLAGTVIFGSISYYFLSQGENENAIIISLLIGGILLIKGFLGPISVAFSLSIAAYGLLHESSHHIPLIKDLIFFVFGSYNLLFEYLTAVIIVLGALANMLTMDLSSARVSDFDF